MFVPRPQILDAPKKIGFGKQFTVPVSIPADLQVQKVQGKWTYPSVLNHRWTYFFTSHIGRSRVLNSCLPLQRPSGFLGCPAIRRPTLAYIHDPSQP